MPRDEIVAFGHENITARHKTTMEVTKEEEVTLRGDCIIGVSANKSVSEISSKVKKKLKEGREAEVRIVLPEYGLEEIVMGRGDEKLSFTHPKDVVIRKSSYTCDRTLLISANKAAVDLDREFVSFLRDRRTELRLIVKII